MNELEIIELFCFVDDFCYRFQEMCSETRIEYTKRKIRKINF